MAQAVELHECDTEDELQAVIAAEWDKVKKKHMINTSINTGKALKAFSLILALSALPLVCALTGCAGNRYTQSTGERIDDKPDSGRVRKALSDDTQYKYGDVSVQTFKGVVQLSGFVNSRDQKNRAGDLAKMVTGAQAQQLHLTFDSFAGHRDDAAPDDEQ